MDEVYNVLDAKELPRFEDSISHKMYVFVLVVGLPESVARVINIHHNNISIQTCNNVRAFLCSNNNDH